MLLEKQNEEDVKSFLEQEKKRIRSVELLKHIQTAAQSSNCEFVADELSDDETDPGLKRPKALDLNPKDFSSALDYVKSFVSETRILHRSDANNEERRAKSLGHVYHSENLQAECFRKQLTPQNLYLTAIIPILSETYSAIFVSKKKPLYTLNKSELMQNK
jgi:hypothetical protein